MAAGGAGVAADMAAGEADTVVVAVMPFLAEAAGEAHRLGAPFPGEAAAPAAIRAAPGASREAVLMEAHLQFAAALAAITAAEDTDTGVVTATAKVRPRLGFLRRPLLWGLLR